MQSLDYNEDQKMIKEETVSYEKFLKSKTTKTVETYKQYKNLFEKLKKGLKSFTISTNSRNVKIPKRLRKS